MALLGGFPKGATRPAILNEEPDAGRDRLLTTKKKVLFLGVVPDPRRVESKKERNRKDRNRSGTFCKLCCSCCRPLDLDGMLYAENKQRFGRRRSTDCLCVGLDTRHSTRSRRRRATYQVAVGWSLLVLVAVERPSFCLTSRRTAIIRLRRRSIY